LNEILTEQANLKSMCIDWQPGIKSNAGTAHADRSSLCWPCMISVARSVSFTVSQATCQQLDVGLLKEKGLHSMLLWSWLSDCFILTAHTLPHKAYGKQPLR
jgi:hypothetical protein